MPEPRASRRAFDGDYVKVDVEEWPGLGPWEVVRMHDASAVLALTPDDRVLLVNSSVPAPGGC